MITDLNRVNNAEELAAGEGTVLPAEERTPEQIGAEIRMYVDVGRRVTLLCAIEIGRRLVEAKDLLSHGEWLPWLEKETEFSERSAQNYMKIFNEYGAAQLGLFGPETNTQTFADLPISKALALLSVPESERIEFAEEVDADRISVRELEEKIREREQKIEELRKGINNERARGDDAVKAQLEAEDLLKTQDRMLAEAKDQIAELSKLNEELEHRPHEVAVETVRDEKAIRAAAEEARKKAEDEAKKAEQEHEKAILKLKAQLEKAEKERDSLKKTAESAGSDAEAKIKEATAETERIRAQLEEAQKKLKASSSDVTKFGVWFSQVQNDFNRMMEVLREVRERDPETGKKLKIGAVTLLKNLLERMTPEET